LKKNKKIKEKGFLFKISLNDFNEKNLIAYSQAHGEEEPTNNIILDWNGFQKILIPVPKENVDSEFNLSQPLLLRLQKLDFPEGSSIHLLFWINH
jgi:hypothetical protein